MEMSGTMITSTTYPPTSSYETPDTVPELFHLDRYEKIFLISFEFLCTFLTIIFNSYLIYIMIAKVKFEGNPQSIPIFTASVLGLFHGFGINLIMTISLIREEWLGSMEWCGAVAHIHKYIVYSIIYCQVVLCLEASYVISHPLSTIRDSTKTLAVVCTATFAAVFITFPVTIAQFFFLFPSNIQEEYPQKYIKYISEMGNKTYVYDEHLHLCHRWFFFGTLDFKIIVYFINAVNTIAAFLIAFSFTVIVLAILRSRALKSDSDNFSSPCFTKKTKDKRRKKQNIKVARLSIFSTLCIVLPWLASFVVSLVIDVNGYKALRGPLGRDWAMNILRWNQYNFYLVTWLFPAMTIVTNPTVGKINKLLMFGNAPAQYRRSPLILTASRSIDRTVDPLSRGVQRWSVTNN